MNTVNDALRRIGELFIVGFPGNSLPAPFLDFIHEERIGGLILFEENCPTHQVAKETIEHFRAAASNDPFIAIDQEGGRVSRLRGAPAEFQGAAVYGRNRDIEHFREHFTRSAVYMESLGINLNLAPVADIRLNETNDCLKDRCFGDDPGSVASFVTAAVEVSRSQHLLCCLKHFPGLGGASIDPHNATATADYDRFVWEQRERIPFEAGIRAGADLLMTTHMVVPAFDEKVVTGSGRIVEELIRSELRFDGSVITDDLTMSGAAVLGSYGERTVAAFNAGHDLLLFGRDYEAAMEAYDYFVAACNQGAIPAERLNDALNRVSGLRFRIGTTATR